MNIRQIHNGQLYMFVLCIFILMFVGCNKGGGGNDNPFNPNPSPVANATMTGPSGNELIASPGVPYNFTVTVSGVNGTGSFSAIFGTTTGAVTTTGISISFSQSNSTGNFSEFASVGNLSSSFADFEYGTVEIIVTYTEPGVVINNNTLTFIITVRSDVESNCANGIDEDGDGLVDCIDPDCSGNIGCETLSVTVDNTGMSFNGGAYKKTIGVDGVDFEIGTDGSFNFTGNQALLNRDFGFLQPLNFETADSVFILRTIATTNVLFLNEAFFRGFSGVLAGFWIEPTSDFTSSTVRQNITNEFTAYLTPIKDHPALIGISIGNEIAFAISQSTTIPAGEKPARISAWFAFLQELAGIGKGIAPNKVFTSAFADLFEIGSGIDATLSTLDFFSFNVYQSTSINRFMEDLRLISAKPAFISEFGVDSWDERITGGAENEPMQRDYVISLAQDIASNPDLIGGTLFEFSDVWWKTGSPNTQDPLPSISTGASPDGGRSECFNGMLKREMSPTPGAINILTPKLLYYAFLDFCTSQNPWPSSSSDATIDSHIDFDFVDQTEYFAGSFSGINAGETIFLVIQPIGGFYYPQNAPVTIAREFGIERIMLIGYVGDASSSGLDFNVFFAIATDSATKDALILAGTSGGIDPAFWPPANTLSFDSNQITVTRN